MENINEFMFSELRKLIARWEDEDTKKATRRSRTGWRRESCEEATSMNN